MKYEKIMKNIFVISFGRKTSPDTFSQCKHLICISCVACVELQWLPNCSIALGAIMRLTHMHRMYLSPCVDTFVPVIRVIAGADKQIQRWQAVHVLGHIRLWVNLHIAWPRHLSGPSAGFYGMAAIERWLSLRCSLYI